MSLSPAPSTSRITTLLRRWTDGDPQARDLLMPLVLEDLRRIARGFFRSEPADHTLQPTALVNEAYMRLVGRRTVHWQNRQQFFAVATKLMRHILIDYARLRRAGKRGGGLPKLQLDESLGLRYTQSHDPFALHEALDSLRRLDPRQAHIVELRFFFGLSNQEIGQVLELSLTSVKRDWRAARLWLYQELTR